MTLQVNVGVEAPAGALSDNTVINIGEVDAPVLPPGLIGIGVPVHFGPEGQQFTQPVTLKIPYKQEDLDKAGITDPNQLDVYTFNITNLTWMLVTGAKTVDTVNRMVMISVDHFSIFQLGVPAAAGCAIDATSQISITRGGFRYNRGTGRFMQQVTLTAAATVPGPISLVLDNLSSNATLYAAAGITACASPQGSPYLNINVDADNVLTAGESVTVILEFDNPSRQGIAYTTRVLAGPDNR